MVKKSISSKRKFLIKKVNDKIKEPLTTFLFQKFLTSNSSKDYIALERGHALPYSSIKAYALEGKKGPRKIEKSRERKEKRVRRRMASRKL